MARTRNIDPDRILDAAGAVVMKHGAQALTLDMVAAAAGISKGGLTYTFPSKEALLSALLDRDVERFRARLEALPEERPVRPYPELRIMLEVFRTKASSAAKRKVGPILAASMHAPGSLKSTRSYLKWMLQKFSPETESGRRARLVFFAAQGLFLLQGFKLLPFTETIRRSVVADFERFLANDPAAEQD
jgi:AcrR family transcriptional regulator